MLVAVTFEAVMLRVAMLKATIQNFKIPSDENTLKCSLKFFLFFFLLCESITNF